MSVANDILNGVGLWIAREERANERDDAAIRSVLEAVNSTKRYLASLDRGEPVNRESEGTLVDLWTNASVHIRRTDLDLSVRLQEKAEYWTNPENWPGDDEAENRIQIDRISRDARNLLKGS
jgi:hypothetical protein|tara:strand:+ start:1085 stop:1450 length:366 start_codon:yes stop_codon:yes gene_type:complete